MIPVFVVMSTGLAICFIVRHVSFTSCLWQALRRTHVEGASGVGERQELHAHSTSSAYTHKLSDGRMCNEFAPFCYKSSMKNGLSGTCIASLSQI
jgi:hypothetical protein